MTYPLSTVGVTISAAGVTGPAYEDILQSYVASLQGIFGSDAYLAADSQEYQLLAILAQAQYDSNQSVIAAVLSFSPSSAVGAGLSRLVKINGLRRQASTQSTCVVSISGVAGTQITNGIVEDASGVLWDLPASVVIPTSGLILVTATCETDGRVSAPAGTLTIPYTPTVGWQAATNALPAVAGSDVESDGLLRMRQSGSTSLNSLTPLAAIQAAVANVPGVIRTAIYENDTDTTDANGFRSHSIAVVAQGGDASAVAAAIEAKKNTGTYTNGDTAVVVTDPIGLPITIRYYQLQQLALDVTVNVKALPGYAASTGAAIQAAVAAFINAQPIGENIYLSWLYGAAGLIGTDLEPTFAISSITVGPHGGQQAATSVALAFNQGATCLPANVAVVVA